MSKRHKHSKWMYKIVIPSLSICAFAVVIYGVKRIDDYQTDKRESYIAENARNGNLVYTISTKGVAGSYYMDAVISKDDYQKYINGEDVMVNIHTKQYAVAVDRNDIAYIHVFTDNLTN
jgi:hypothetical protein